MSQENIDIFEYYLYKFNSTYVDPIIIIELIIILIFVFFLRYKLLNRIEKNKNKDKSIEELKNISSYIIGHCAVELLVAFFVAFLFVKLTNANPQRYITNMIVCPSIGMLVAIYFDNKLLIPVENATGIGNVFEKIISSKKKIDSSSNTNTTTNNQGNVTINIGTQLENNNQPEMRIKSSSLSKFLSDDLADDKDFNTKIIDAINVIKQEQSTQIEIINANTVRLENTMADLAILKASEMINKKIELKKIIYSCLNKGYANPEENDKITMYYHSYISLGGNHEVESLYKNHYLKLPVHEDDDFIVHNIKVDPNKKQQKRVYLYGELDNIIDECD